MTTDSWTIIGTAIVILIAIAASNRSLRMELRADLRGLENRMNDADTKLHGRIDAFEAKLTGRIDGVNERVNRLEAEFRGRLGRVEGMLEFIRDSFFDRRKSEPEPAPTRSPRSSAPP